MDKRIETFIEDIKQEPLVQKNLYRNPWLSGSSTYVHAITIWRDEIVLQWKSHRNIYNHLIKRIVDENKDIIDYGYFRKTDGSNPSSIVFRLKTR